MEDTLVGFKVAKLAKEKGYKEPCVNWYNFSGLLIKDSATKQYPSNDKRFPSYSAPTSSLLQQWFRKTQGLVVDALPFRSEDSKETLQWYYIITNILTDTPIYLNADTLNASPENFSSYEEALENGLINALKL